MITLSLSFLYKWTFPGHVLSNFLVPHLWSPFVSTCQVTFNFCGFSCLSLPFPDRLTFSILCWYSSWFLPAYPFFSSRPLWLSFMRIMTPLKSVGSSLWLEMNPAVVVAIPSAISFDGCLASLNLSLLQYKYLPLSHLPNRLLTMAGVP